MSIGYDDGNLFSFLEAAQHNSEKWASYARIILGNWLTC